MLCFSEAINKLNSYNEKLEEKVAELNVCTLLIALLFAVVSLQYVKINVINSETFFLVSQK